MLHSRRGCPVRHYRDPEICGIILRIELAQKRSAGRKHCGEFACQSGKSRHLHTNIADYANCKITKLRRVR